MDTFSKEDKARIAAAISEAETTTSGEIVAVVAARSDDYFYIPLLWAAVIALIVPWPLLGFTALGAWTIFIVQLLVFLLISLAARFPAIASAMIPGPVKRARAHKHALEQFLAQGMHATKGRTGVLIFVSVAEHFAEIIADEDIYAKTRDLTWRKIVDELTGHIESGDPASGFVAAIAASGKVLAEHFPPGSIEHNELPNQLIMLD